MRLISPIISPRVVDCGWAWRRLRGNADAVERQKSAPCSTHSPRMAISKLSRAVRVAGLRPEHFRQKSMRRGASAPDPACDMAWRAEGLRNPVLPGGCWDFRYDLAIKTP